MKDIQDLNIELFNKAMSYMPGTNQFHEQFKEYGSEADDEEIDVNAVVDSIVLTRDKYYTIETVLELNGPTTWIEFKFTSPEYEFDSLESVVFHTTAFDNKEYSFEYSQIDFEALYNAYM